MLKSVVRKIRANQESYNINNISDAVELIHSGNRYFKANNKEVLIVKIAKQMGFDIYTCNFDKDTMSGICISPDLSAKFQLCDKIIMVNTNARSVYKRFGIAYEIGNYLFNFPNSTHNMEYYNLSTFSQLDLESLINIFASELLLPKKIFLKEYKRLKSHGDNAYYEIASEISKEFNVPIKNVLEMMKRYEMTN